MRLDVYLTAKGLARSRNHAARLIEGGYVSVNGRTEAKPSFFVDEATVDVTLAGEPYPFVGRGGLKLAKALDVFSIEVTDFVAVDVGASTGGFTDCLLRRGAKKVFAIDSGFGQLADSLKNDIRVVNIEHFNARNLTPATLGTLCDIAVADLSFISQTYVLSNIASVLMPGAVYIGLIKPQFECGPAATDHRGIVKSPKLHLTAIHRVVEAAVKSGLSPREITDSPILGGDGNREFLLYCRRDDNAQIPDTFQKQLRELVKT